MLPVGLGKALRETYQGISPALIKQLVALPATAANPSPALLPSTPVDTITPDQWSRLHQRWLQWLRHLDQTTFSLQLEKEGGYCVWNGPDIERDDDRDNALGDCLSLPLGLYYRHHLNARRLQRRTDELRQLLQVSREREQAQRQEQQHRMEDTNNAETLQRQADTLLCQQNPDRDSIDRAQKLYQVPDYDGPSP